MRLPSSTQSEIIVKNACFEPSVVCELWMFLFFTYNICFELVFSFVSINVTKAMLDGLFFFKQRKTFNATHFYWIFPLESKKHNENTKIFEMQKFNVSSTTWISSFWLVWILDNVLCRRFQFNVENCLYLQWHSFKSDGYTFFIFFLLFCIRQVEHLGEWAQIWKIECVYNSNLEPFQIKRISEIKWEEVSNWISIFTSLFIHSKTTGFFVWFFFCS